MKTAKLGAIFLISIMALAGIGAGYAMWTDTVTVHGSITTGTVIVGIYDVSTDDPGPNYNDGGWLYPDGSDPANQGTADPYVAPGDNSDGKNIASHNSVTHGEYVCTKEIAGENIVFRDQITETIRNAYPWYLTGTTTWISNCGTIPVKLLSSNYLVTDGNVNILNYIVIESWQLREYDGTTWTTGVSGDDVIGLMGAIIGYQLEPCHTLEMYVAFNFIEENADGVLMPQGDFVTFDIDITFAQWNEV